MIITKFRRVVRSGWVSFWRSGYVSLASVLVMTITLSVLAWLMFTSTVLTSTLSVLRDKVDIRVYFVTSAPEEQILTMKKRLEELPEVASVSYTSREQALENFKVKHADEVDIMQSLTMLEDNPLQASLNIKAKDSTKYESIAQFLEPKTTLSSDTSSIIRKVTYYQNKKAIDSLNQIIEASNKLGLILGIFFALISVLITFNTIRLAIYSSREEIGVMRLVGASHRYIRGPFVIEGLMYGFFSAILTIVLLYPALYWFGPLTDKIGTGVNLFEYYLKNIFQIGAILLVAGLLIGAFSSYLAVKKYLKV